MLRTTVRLDAPLTGAAAAAAIPFVTRLAPRARLISGLSLVALVPLLYFTAPASGYFGWPGLLLDLSLAGFVIACTIATPARFVTTSLGSRLLTYLGRRSLSLYLWHYPIFWFVSRHTHDWGWEARTLVALSLTVAIAELSERLVESRVQKLLQSPAWKEMERGIPRYLGRQVKSRIPSRSGRSN
jgi:peptidoglycan/LPS O-acetylase OafA/YrhL